MPQDIVETFARSLIDQIVLEAFDEAKSQPKEEVSQTQTQRSNMYMEYNKAEEPEVLERMVRDLHLGYGKTEEQEVLDRMVHDLGDAQIGDSRFVYSPPVTRFDRQQARRPACFVDNASIDDSGDVVEMSGIRGQGDVESIARDAVSTESKETESTTNSYPEEKEQQPGANDPAKVSVNQLHRMIEELETVTEDPNDTEEITKPVERSKEEIAIWEEKEETLIRIIEGTEGSLESVTEESRSIRQFVDEDREELKSSMLMSGASSSRNLSFDEVYIEESTSDCPPRRASVANEIEGSQVLSAETKEETKEEAASEKKKKKKKRKKEEEKKKESLARKLKRFFLRSVKREKN